MAGHWLNKSGGLGGAAWREASAGALCTALLLPPPLLASNTLFPFNPHRSLPQTLADAKERGWQVLGAAAEPGAQPASAFVLQQPAILVMGNEGYGLRGAVRRLCDAMLQVGVGRSGAEQR